MQGLNPDAPRKLKFIPGIIFVDESSLMPDKNFENSIQEVKEILNQSSFPHHIVKLEEVLFTCSFICRGISNRKQRRDLFGLRVKLPPVTTSLATQR